MSDEEKKEYIEHEILDRLYCVDENDFDKDKVDESYIKAVLNACKEAKKLIENQQKEIEELKEERKKYPIAMNDEQYKKVIELAQKDIKEELDRQINVRMINEEYIEKNYISKEKIKELKEIDNIDLIHFKIKEMLKELLEEE